VDGLGKHLNHQRLIYICHNCGANNAPAKQEKNKRCTKKEKKKKKAQNGKKLISKEETYWMAR
jgi:hypothetical protein